MNNRLPVYRELFYFFAGMFFAGKSGRREAVLIF